ncbi:MAG: RNA polymerase sigma factor [Actinomycetota bacterium]
MTPSDAAAQKIDVSQNDDLTVSVTTESVTVQVTPAAPEVEVLVARAKEGDRQAFAALYRLYLPSVYKFLFYRVGNKAQTEDMTAEVFLRALRKVQDFTWTGADFGAWLMRIARNLVLDEAKSSRARLEVLNDEMPEDAAGENAPAEAAAIEKFVNVEVYKAIKRLRPDQQEVITLRFLHGMGVQDVAKLMDKKEGTVRTLQFRGLKALEKILVAKGVVDAPAALKIRPEGVRVESNGRDGDISEAEAARFGDGDGDR